MNELKINIYQTYEMTNEMIKTVNTLKNQHWKHSMEEHMEWFRANIGTEDYHILISEKNNLIAYLNLVQVEAWFDEQRYNMLGIGNVCVDKTRGKLGIGTILMSVAKTILKEINTCGIVLCKENRVKFYRECGWKPLDVMKKSVSGRNFEHFVMFYDPTHMIPSNSNTLNLSKDF